MIDISTAITGRDAGVVHGLSIAGTGALNGGIRSGGLIVTGTDARLTADTSVISMDG